MFSGTATLRLDLATFTKIKPNLSQIKWFRDQTGHRGAAERISNSDATLQTTTALTKNVCARRLSYCDPGHLATFLQCRSLLHSPSKRCLMLQNTAVSNGVSSNRFRVFLRSACRKGRWGQFAAQNPIALSKALNQTPEKTTTNFSGSSGP